MADFFGLDLADEVLKQIAEKGNVKTVKEELMKDPKVQTLAKLLTKNGDLLFYRKGILHNMICVEFYIETPIVFENVRTFIHSKRELWTDKTENSWSVKFCGPGKLVSAN